MTRYGKRVNSPMTRTVKADFTECVNHLFRENILLYYELIIEISITVNGNLATKSGVSDVYYYTITSHVIY